MPARDPDVLRADDQGGLLMGHPAPVRYLCVGDDHLRIGRSVPDEHGFLTVNDGQWAYCSAARPQEAHRWKAIAPTHLFALHHESLRRKFAEPSNAAGKAQTA